MEVRGKPWVLALTLYHVGDLCQASWYLCQASWSGILSLSLSCSQGCAGITDTRTLLSLVFMQVLRIQTQVIGVHNQCFGPELSHLPGPNKNTFAKAVLAPLKFLRLYWWRQAMKQVRGSRSCFPSSVSSSGTAFSSFEARSFYANLSTIKWLDTKQ